MKKLAYYTMTFTTALMLLTSGCAKKDDNNGGQPVAPPAAPVLPAVPACGNCGATTALLGTVRAIAPLSGFEMAMDLFGDAARVNAQDLKALVMYNGSIAGKANVRITSNVLCKATTGDYVATTLQVGMGAGAVIGNLAMTSIGPGGARIDFTILQGTMYNGMDPQGLNRDSKTNQIYANIRIDSVNGQPCGMTSTTY